MIKYICDNCLNEFEPTEDIPLVRKEYNERIGKPYYGAAESIPVYRFILERDNLGDTLEFQACSLKCAQEYYRKAEKRKGCSLVSPYYGDSYIDDVSEKVLHD